MICVVPHCERDATDLLEYGICSHHARKIYLAVRDMLDNPSREAAEEAVRSPKQGARRNVTTTPGVVYFARFGDLVKIGFTTNLQGRLRSLQPDELLAATPGTMLDERRLHAQFGPSWVSGEFFDLTPEIQDYIDALNGPL